MNRIYSRIERNPSRGQCVKSRHCLFTKLEISLTWHLTLYTPSPTHRSMVFQSYIPFHNNRIQKCVGIINATGGSLNSNKYFMGSFFIEGLMVSSWPIVWVTSSIKSKTSILERIYCRHKI